MTDLWPNDLGDSALLDVKSPLSILKEQASILGTKTRMIVKAEVARGNKEFYLRRDLISEEDFKKFVYEFYIFAPFLDYRYRLFSIIHDIDLYHVKFIPDVEIETEILGVEGVHVGLRADSESQFMEVLSRILNSSKAKKVIRSLLAQSTEIT